MLIDLLRRGRRSGKRHQFCRPLLEALESRYLLNGDPIIELKLDVAQEGTSIVDQGRQFHVLEGTAFDLEFRYSDLRPNQEGMGAFTVFADILAENADAIRPLLNETQVVGFSSNFNESTGGHLVIEVDGQSAIIPIVSDDAQAVPDMATRPVDALTKALEVDLGIGPETIEIRVPQREAEDPIVYAIRYRGDQFAYIDMPDIAIDTSNVVSDSAVAVSIVEVTPYVDHSAAEPVINPLAFPYNIDTHSSSLFGERIYKNSVSGSYEPEGAELFNELGGAGPLHGGGLPGWSMQQYGPQGALPPPVTDFEVLSLRVEALRPQEDVIFTLDLADGVTDVHAGEITPYGLSRELGPEEILIDLDDDPLVPGDDRFGLVSGTILPTPGFVISATQGLQTSEAGATASFEFSLLTTPLADVSVDLSSAFPDEVSVSPASLMFTPENAKVAQTVTVTPVDDQVDEPDQPFTIVTAAVRSEDRFYNHMDPPDITGTNLDDDVAGVLVQPVEGLETSESGGTAEFTVVLLSEPTADVRIGFSSSVPDEVQVNESELTFTAANWDTPQLVTIAGQDDQSTDGDQDFTIVSAEVESADLRYAGIDPSDPTGQNLDDEVAGIELIGVEGIVVSEAETFVEFSVVLSTLPTSDVTLGLSVSHAEEIQISTAELIFTSENGRTPQTVRVTGVDDLVDDGPQFVSVLTTALESDDLFYDGLAVPDISVTNQDDDTAGIAISAPTDRVTDETGDSFQVSVRLETIPQSNVLVPVSVDDPSEAFLDRSFLLFTPDDALQPKTFLVTGRDDNDVDGDVDYNVRIEQAVTSDSNYRIDPGDLTATNLDDDVPLSQLDFGDTPQPYPTSLAEDGARHASGGVFLGTVPDLETDAHRSDLADQDAFEDGIEWLTTIVADSTASTTSSLTVQASGQARLDGWIDFNRDGDWLDPGEQIADSLPLNSGLNFLEFQVPAGSVAGPTFARFRASTSGGLQPTGLAADGEVEDYRIVLEDGDVGAVAQVPQQSSQVRLSQSSTRIEVSENLGVLFSAELLALNSLFVAGTHQDDTVELSSVLLTETPLSLDAATGEDTLRLLGTTTSLNLIDASGQLANFEIIDAANQEIESIIIDSRSLIDASDAGNELTLRVDASDQVDLQGEWILADADVASGTFEHVFISGEATLKVSGWSAWRNPLSPLDVNNNRRVTAVDALQILNQLSQRDYLEQGSSDLVDALFLGNAFPEKYYDTNDDGKLTPIDALRVINEVGRIVNGSGEWNAAITAATGPSQPLGDEERIDAAFAGPEAESLDRVEAVKVFQSRPHETIRSASFRSTPDEEDVDVQAVDDVMRFWIDNTIS